MNETMRTFLMLRSIFAAMVTTKTECVNRLGLACNTQMVAQTKAMSNAVINESRISCNFGCTYHCTFGRSQRACKSSRRVSLPCSYRLNQGNRTFPISFVQDWLYAYRQLYHFKMFDPAAACREAVGSDPERVQRL
jgi:hypothetical protein